MSEVQAKFGFPGLKFDSQFESGFKLVGSGWRSTLQTTIRILGSEPAIPMTYHMSDLIEGLNVPQTLGHIGFFQTKIDISMSSYTVRPEIPVRPSLTKILDPVTHPQLTHFTKKKVYDPNFRISRT